MVVNSGEEYVEGLEVDVEGVEGVETDAVGEDLEDDNFSDG